MPDNIYPDQSNDKFDIQYARLLGLSSDLRASFGVFADSELPAGIPFETPSDDDTGIVRFGVAAEDDLAGQNRSFDLAGAYSFALTQLGNNQFLVDPTNGLYQLGAIPVPGSDSGLSYTYLEVNDTTGQITLQAPEGIVLPGYGVGVHMATPAYSLGVDASGNLVEFVSSPGGSVTADNGITMSTATNVQLGSATSTGSPLLHHTFLYGANTFTFNLNDVRFETDKGANVTAANDLVLGLDGNIFTATGNTQINAITSTNWQTGSFVIIETTGTPLFKHNTTGGAGTLPMKLAGSSDFQAAVDDAILFYNNGSFWHELARKQAAQGGVYTFLEGLTESTGNQVKLGAGTSGPSFSPFTANRFINVAGFTLQVTGSGEAFKVITTTVGNAMQIQNSGNGNALFAITNAGIALLGQSTYSSTNAIEELLRLNRFSSGGAGANGIGSKIVFNLETSTSTSQNSAYIASTWIDATNATRTGDLQFAVVTNTNIHNALVLSGQQSTLLSNDAGTGQTSQRFSVVGTYKALTDSTATAFVRVNIPSGAVTGGEILITVEANDATDFQSRTLRFIWSAVNKAGTITATVQTPEEAVAVSAGTLTVTIDTNDAGSGNLDFRANATSSLTETTLRCSYQVFKNIGTGVITPQ